MIIGHQVEKAKSYKFSRYTVGAIPVLGSDFRKDRDNDPKHFSKPTNSSQIRVRISWFRSGMTIKVTVFNMYAITQSILKIPIGLKVCKRIN